MRTGSLTLQNLHLCSQNVQMFVWSAFIRQSRTLDFPPQKIHWDIMSPMSWASRLQGHTMQWCRQRLDMNSFLNSHEIWIVSWVLPPSKILNFLSQFLFCSGYLAKRASVPTLHGASWERFQNSLGQDQVQVWLKIMKDIAQHGHVNREITGWRKTTRMGHTRFLRKGNALFCILLLKE